MNKLTLTKAAFWNKIKIKSMFLAIGLVSLLGCHEAYGKTYKIRKSSSTFKVKVKPFKLHKIELKLPKIKIEYVSNLTADEIAAINFLKRPGFSLKDLSEQSWVARHQESNPSARPCFVKSCSLQTCANGTCSENVPAFCSKHTNGKFTKLTGIRWDDLSKVSNPS